ncbi:MAG: hypothetical protein RTU30_06285 [Candidatus Thorarchaeota archaeon]
MSPPKKDTKKGNKKTRYLFKITVVGPDDNILDQVLAMFGQHVVAVDGIRIGAGGLETEGSDVKALIMSPRHAAMDVLLSVTYKGASGVIIILKEPDPHIETIYRNEIREKMGVGIPTRVLAIEGELDEYKKEEITLLFEEIIEEILALKEEESE